MEKTNTQVLRPVRADRIALADHPALRRLLGDDEGVRRRFAQEARPVLLPGGHLLFAEGDPADSLYVVLTGRLVVFHERRGRERLETEIGVGELCGERAVVMGGQRTGSVRAMRDSELLELDKADFERLVAAHPDAMLRMTRDMATRLARIPEESDLRGAVTTLAIVAVHPSPHVLQLAHRLASALSTCGPTRLLDAAALDGELGEGAAVSPFSGPRAPDIAAFLHRQEADHRFVLYLADDELTGWTRRCIRQADRVLLVAERDADPGTGAVEAYLRDTHEGSVANALRELVLLEPGGRGRHRAAGPWCVGRDLLGHHFVDPERPAEVERLARFLAGKAVGLVLSGGGARACAHLGAVRALREAGLPIDLVGGTSGGAIIAGELAMGWDPAEMLSRSRTWLIEGPRLFDVSLPIHGLIEGRRFKEALVGLFGETRIEDLRTPFFCVSTNLSRGEMAVHRRGPLARWVRASISIPGLGPPLFDAGEVYVDGSVLNNMPLDVMRDRSAGPIVAVNVGAEEGPRAAPGVDSVPSAWQVFRSRVLHKGEAVPEVPSIIDVLMGSAMISGVQRSRAFERMAELIVRPDVQGFGQLEFSALEAMAEEGYRATVAALEAYEGDLLARWLGREGDSTAC